MARLLILFVLLIGTFVMASEDGEEVRTAMGQGMISMICTQTLYECAEITSSKCTEMAQNAVDACPVDEFKDISFDLPRDVYFEAMKKAANSFSSCFIAEFRHRAQEQDMPTKCIDKAVTASTQARVREYRKKQGI